MTADYTPTPEQVEAFKKAWHEADAEGDEGNRVSRGLAAALAQRDVELRAEVERLRAVSAAQPYETERELAVALDEARRELADLRAGIEALRQRWEDEVSNGCGSRREGLRAALEGLTHLAGSGEQPGERDATPDEAHDIGYAKGHTDGYREALAEHPAPAVPDSPDVLRAKASAAVAVLHAEKFRELGRLATADEVTDAVLAAAGPIIAAQALREAAQWLAATGYPTDWHTDVRVPDALWEAFVDAVHEGDDGRELPREEVESWMAEEAGRIARGEGS